MIKKGAQCYTVIAEHGKQDNKGKACKWHSKIEHILLDYSFVLNEPQGLPPKREFDHHIPLKDEAQPVNVETKRRN